MQFDTYQNQAIDILLGLPQDEKKYLSFSGGKDSTALLGLAFVAACEGFTNWEVNHSNTLMEIPMMDAHIEECIKTCNEHGIKFNYIVPTIENRFFYNLIGKGIPTPHRSFRWCTDRLKLKPQENFIKSQKHTSFISITGERMGESNKRDQKLKEQCDSTNECGIVDLKSSFFKSTVRPLLKFSTCQVWDTLALLDLSDIIEGSLERLEAIYSISEQDSGDSLRTGCIGCPLINKDRSLARFVQSSAGYAPLEKLGAIYKSFATPENRIMRADNKSLGAVKLSHRKAMYQRILEIEAEVRQLHPDFILIHPEERAVIDLALSEQRYPQGYSREYLLSVGAVD